MSHPPLLLRVLRVAVWACVISLALASAKTNSQQSSQQAYRHHTRLHAEGFHSRSDRRLEADADDGDGDAGTDTPAGDGVSARALRSRRLRIRGGSLLQQEQQALSTGSRARAHRPWTGNTNIGRSTMIWQNPVTSKEPSSSSDDSASEVCVGCTKDVTVVDSENIILRDGNPDEEHAKFIDQTQYMATRHAEEMRKSGQQNTEAKEKQDLVNTQKLVFEHAREAADAQATAAENP